MGGTDTSRRKEAVIALEGWETMQREVKLFDGKEWGNARRD